MDPGERQHPEWMRELDHTADVGLEIDAADLAQLFERAAYAMFWLLSDVDDVEPDLHLTVRIDAGDLDDLMVSWLSELNYRHQVDGLVFSRFEMVDITEESLEATVWGEGIWGGRPAVFGELKAVTYHDLTVECSEEGCHARIIFDI